MNSSTSGTSMLSRVTSHEFAPPTPQASKKAFLFSIAVHLLLVAALTWGVSWSTRDNSSAVEAELWQSVPILAAPKLEDPPPEEQIVDTPAPPPPAAAPPKPIDNTQAIREAQLATAKLKKLEEEKLEQERQARVLLETERLKKEKLEKEKLEKEKAEKIKAEKIKAEKDKADKEKAEKEKLEKAEKEKKAKEKADAKKSEKEAAHQKEIEDKKREAIRQEQLNRMRGLSGATGSPDSSGAALRSSGPSASYAGRIKGRVKPNIIYPDISPSENPVAEVLVRVSSDGTILSRRLTKASGNAAWDNAVLKAIDKTERFPRDTDGSVPSEIIITFKPNE